MALTLAHHDGRDRFAWGDLVEAMTTIESGTAIGIEYIASETRAVAIHEAGHAAAGHVFMKGAESTRLSIRMRGGSLGHHQALEKEERFSRFRSDEMARLVWTLGAMAAEHVFYGENSNGVGGDVQSATAQAAWMVGASAMGPEPFTVTPLDDESEEEARAAGAEALRGDRPPDHEPHERRRPVQRQPDRRRARRPRQARRPRRRSSARRTSPRTTSSSTTRTRSRRSPTSSSCAARCSGTSWSRSSTTRSCRCPRSTTRTRTHGRRCDPGRTAAEPELLLVPTGRTGRARRRTASASASSTSSLAAIVGAGVGSFIVLASRPAPPEAAGLVELGAERQQARARAPDRRPDPQGVHAAERRAADREPGEPARRADRAGRRAGHVDLRPPRHLAAASRRRTTSTPTPAPTSSRTGSAASAPARSARSRRGSRPASASRCCAGRRSSSRSTRSSTSTTSTRCSSSCRRRRRATATARSSCDATTSPTSSAGRSRACCPQRKPRVGAISEVELGNILRLTQPRTYAFQFQAASDGRPVLILTPPSAGS